MNGGTLEYSRIEVDYDAIASQTQRTRPNRRPITLSELVALWKYWGTVNRENYAVECGRAQSTYKKLYSKLQASCIGGTPDFLAVFEKLYP